jgi:hypothetical protein
MVEQHVSSRSLEARGFRRANLCSFSTFMVVGVDEATKKKETKGKGAVGKREEV